MGVIYEIVVDKFVDFNVVIFEIDKLVIEKIVLSDLL